MDEEEVGFARFFAYGALIVFLITLSVTACETAGSYRAYLSRQCAEVSDG